MINVTCPQCGTSAELPNSAAGCKGKCRNCFCIVRVPVVDINAGGAVAADFSTNSQPEMDTAKVAFQAKVTARKSAHGQGNSVPSKQVEDDQFARTTFMTLIIGVIMFAVLGSAYWLGVSRPAHLRTRLTMLKGEADRLAASGQLEPAIEKYQQLLSEARSHHAEYLAESAQTSSKIVATQLDAQRAEIQQQQVAKRQQAEDLLKWQAANRLYSQQQQQTAADLASKRQAEQKAAGQLAAQQAQEHAKQDAIANAPRLVSGSVWVKRGDGTNLDQRGLTLFLLRPNVPQALYTKHHKELRKIACDEIESLRGDRAIYSESTGFADLDNSNREKMESIDSLISTISDSVRTLDDQKDQLESPTKLIFAIVRNIDAIQNGSHLRSVSYDTVWPDIVDQLVLGKVQTDATGHYAVQLQRGQYVLYAMSQTDNWIAEWTISIDADAPGSQELNLFNDNASIVNR